MHACGSDVIPETEAMLHDESTLQQYCDEIHYHDSACANVDIWADLF